MMPETEKGFIHKCVMSEIFPDG